MKCVVRQSVFETNSSNEHSFTVTKKSNFLEWKAGRMFGRQLPGHEDSEVTWGNFWSEQYYWEFEMLTLEQVEERNRASLKEEIEQERKSIYAYIPQADESGKKWATRRLEELNDISFETLKPVSKLYYGMWLSYDEYQEALRHDDCYSPFEHINHTEDVAIFGKYFHS